MTFALVAIRETTYGGVYLANPFTTSGVQPTWTKLTTTGLPSLTPDIFRVAYDDPLNKQYLGFNCDSETGGGTATIYRRNGGDWSLCMDLATAKTATGNVNIDGLRWLWTDYTVPGTVYSVCTYQQNALTAYNYVLKSTDYGSTWTSIPCTTQQDYAAYVQVQGDVILLGLRKNVLAASQAFISMDAGATWDIVTIASGGGTPEPHINLTDPLTSYYTESGAGVRRIIISGPPTSIVSQATAESTAVIHPDEMYCDEDSDGYAVCLSGADLKWTDDYWASTNLVSNISPTAFIHAITGLWNEPDGFVFGTANGGPGARIYYITNKTDPAAENRSGSNSTVAPYTDAVPEVGYVIEYGIWAGSLEAATGVFVFSVEMENGDLTWDDSIFFGYDALGSPMGGDRSSFRDMYADGFDVYHAEDVHAATPQIHAPWPAADGEAPVSDGTKYVPTDIITQAEFDYSFYVIPTHDPVTLDADAQTILDLQGAGGQEIGLDVQQPTYVWMGPSFAPADEPTFRPMYIEELANVITTAPIGDGEVLTYDASIGQWINEDAPGDVLTSDLHEHIINEDHSADCDGVAVNFTTAYIFRPLSTQVYLNGLRQRLGPSFYLEDIDYNGITFDTAPEDDDMLWLDYIVEYIDYIAALSDSEDVDLIDSEDVALEDSS